MESKSPQGRTIELAAILRAIAVVAVYLHSRVMQLPFVKAYIRQAPKTIVD